MSKLQKLMLRRFHMNASYGLLSIPECASNPKKYLKLLKEIHKEMNIVRK